MSVEQELLDQLVPTDIQLSGGVGSLRDPI